MEADLAPDQGFAVLEFIGCRAFRVSRVYRGLGIRVYGLEFWGSGSRVYLP